MNAHTTAWICHGCKRRGNAITFLAWHKGLPEAEARRLLEERYGRIGVSLPAGSLEDAVLRLREARVPPKEHHRKPPVEMWLKEFSVDWLRMEHTAINIQEYETYMVRDRKFSIDALHDWQIGYDRYSDRITIPIFSESGRLVGFKGRAYKQGHDPRYMILGDSHGKILYGFEPYQKSKYVFGVHKCPPEWDKRNMAVIVEGELNAIALNERAGYDGFAVGGSEFSEAQREIIVRHADTVVVFLDNDQQGNRGTKQVAEQLMPYMHVEIVTDAPADAAGLDGDKITELVNNSKSALELQICGKL